MKDAIASFLHKAGVQEEVHMTSLKGGKNNRVFHVESQGKSFLLKSYFWHPEDRRERLRAEFLFSTFLWDRGIRNIPQPIASDPTHQLGLYAFVKGRKFAPSDVTATSIQKALDFFLAMNAHQKEEGARQLPPASEACFSLKEHGDHVQRRIERLKNFKETDPIALEAKGFIMGELFPQWEKARKKVFQAGAGLLAKQERCLSPSDFGFHNALFTPEEEIYFHDFEYAGWDDPARMVCDFFCQPELPIPMFFFEDFAKQVFHFLDSPAGLEKTHLLLPVYRIKWCCILLNEFLREGGSRRKFAQRENNIPHKKSEQLAKAKIYFGKYVEPIS